MWEEDKWGRPGYILHTVNNFKIIATAKFPCGAKTCISLKIETIIILWVFHNVYLKVLCCYMNWPGF